MADEKKEAVAEEVKAAPVKKAAKAAAPKKAEVKADAKPAAKKADDKAEAKKVVFADPIEHDYEVILNPIITEKSMALIQNENKVTIKVAASANKLEIKESFQRLYKAAVADIKIINKLPKEKSRGGRYKGFVSGYKKAIVTLTKGTAIDLFKE